MPTSSSQDENQATPDQAMLGTAESLNTTNLEDLQTEEQRRVLDTVAQIRKCGLESILSLPQLVVCGDQSAGKSSVLEALTEIPFPRNDNLCTRFATEIILRHGTTETLTVKVIPDSARPPAEKSRIESFKESIRDFGDLPRIMELAKSVMGIYEDAVPGTSQPQAFAKDVLSIEIVGPARPQLTLVDIPGLIQSSTKGVSDEDVALVTEITDNYISQHRTICLPVVCATNDAANQSILRKVRVVDPNGDRTLGIVTKPDRLPSGSGSEAKFIELARNEDVFFKLGWHVLKNRTFEQSASSLMERNASEALYFRTSNFNQLPKENVGIDALRSRLSLLLFEHVKQELPELRKDLELALDEAQSQLRLLGDRRSAVAECRAYLAQLSLDFWEVCKEAVNGHYESDYFGAEQGHEFALESSNTIARLRAVVQYLNTEFESVVRTKGHKYQLHLPSDSNSDEGNSQQPASQAAILALKGKHAPITLERSAALKWVRQALVRTRGKELVGNFNPLLIGELFWEQSFRWRKLAEEHIEQITRVCERFLDNLLDAKCPKDVKSRTWSSQIVDKLKARRARAFHELDMIMQDIKSFPVNYNHYYTDTITKRRRDRQKSILAESLESATTHEHLPGCNSTHTSARVDVQQMVSTYSSSIDPNMDNFSCEEALDCLIAIYKVSTVMCYNSRTSPLSLDLLIYG